MVYNRIAQNRRKTWFLVAIAILSIVPFVGGLAWGATRVVLIYFGHSGPYGHVTSPLTQQFQQRYEETLLKLEEERYGEYGEYGREYVEQLRAEVRRKAEEQKKRLEREQAEDRKLGIQVMILVSSGSMAILGILFWALASSPTSRLLTMCGARPAGHTGKEAEARRLLENLAIGAGLPTPRLYVIDTSTPNAFAAGMDVHRSVVAVTSGILGLLEHRELEGVLAHELSHIGNRDTRLNTIVASIALFLRLPYLFRQQAKMDGPSSTPTPYALRRRFQMYNWVLLPVYIYIFFVAPVLAAAIRAAISRSREFLADADAALLTRYPEGLVRALSKIRGAGSAVAGSNPAVAHLYFADPAEAAGMSLFSGNLLATHPPIDDRITRLVEFNGGMPVALVESAVKAGQQFSANHPAAPEANTLLDNMTKGELAVVTMGNPMGRVFRVVSANGPFPVYERCDPHSAVLARVNPGDLLIVFDDPGRLRQVVTHREVFGYLPFAVKLQRVDMLPSEIHDPAARAAATAAQPKAMAVAAAEVPKAAMPVAGNSGLTGQQIKIAAAFGVAVFGLVMAVLYFFSGN